MKHYVYIISLIVVAAMAVSCGRSKNFTVKGEIDGLSTSTLRAVFFGDGALQNVPVQVVDGKFEFRGRSAEPTIVTLYYSDRSPMGRMVARNGDKLEVKFDRAKRFEYVVKGNDASEQLSRWVTDNSALLDKLDPRAINREVAAYVEGHSDDIVSTVLMLTFYDSTLDNAEATRLLDMIAPDAKPGDLVNGYLEMVSRESEARGNVTAMPIRYYTGGDTALTFRPASSPRTLIVVSNSQSGRDTVVPTLRKIARLPKMKIFDISTDVDSMLWKRNIQSDSATWLQGWIPTALAAPGVDILAVPRLPYFIVIDSAGRILLRSPSVTTVLNSVR